jgi:CheY-like chemotaxis protein
MKTTETRILIVDDEKAFTDLLQVNLLDEGFSVRVENDGRHAIAAAHEFHPDLILLDIVMPHTDGSDILRVLKSDSELSHTPTILISALVSSQDVDEDGGCGIQTPDGIVMAKPVQFSKLMQCIEEALAPVA